MYELSPIKIFNLHFGLKVDEKFEEKDVNGHKEPVIVPYNDPAPFPDRLVRYSSITAGVDPTG